MEVRPPYLFPENDRPDPSLTVISDVSTASVEMAVHGRWGRRLGAEVSIGIRKCLAEHPSALIADLRDLDDPAGLSAPMWLVMRRICQTVQPPVQPALCLASDAALAVRLGRLGAWRHLPAFASMSAARGAMTSRLPLTDLLRVRLAPEPTSARLARDLVDRACSTWRLPELRQAAQLVLSELVANVIEHAGTDAVVTVSRRGPGLHLSVRDGSPALPRLVMPAPGDTGWLFQEHGRGLLIVHTAASAWGAMPTRDGKVVWAMIRGRSDLPAGPGHRFGAAK